MITTSTIQQRNQFRETIETKVAAQTVGAPPVAILSIELPDDSNITIDITLHGKQVGGNNDRVSIVLLLAFKTASGMSDMIGEGATVVSDLRDAGAAGWTGIDASFDGLTLNLTIAGEAAKTVDWDLFYRVIE